MDRPIWHGWVYIYPYVTQTIPTGAIQRYMPATVACFSSSWCSCYIAGHVSFAKHACQTTKVHVSFRDIFVICDKLLKLFTTGIIDVILFAKYMIVFVPDNVCVDWPIILQHPVIQD